MTSALSTIPVGRRRHMAATLGLFAMLFIAIGAVAATGSGGAVMTAFVIVALVIALLLALVAWGIAHSVRVDTAGDELDAAIEAALAAGGKSLDDFGCGSGCGHDHDPDELHVADDPCGHDGGGHECSRTCDTCVLSRLRSIPASAALDGGADTRPSPRPAPRPAPVPPAAGAVQAARRPKPVADNRPVDNRVGAHRAD